MPQATVVTIGTEYPNIMYSAQNPPSGYPANENPQETYPTNQYLPPSYPTNQYPPPPPSYYSSAIAQPSVYPAQQFT